VAQTDLPVRLAGRVIVLDPADRVLLFRYDDPPPNGRHWATPGGGLSPGEDYHAAASRELAEETGWTDVPVRPGEVHRLTATLWTADHRLVSQHERYFVARVPVERRPLGEVSAMHVSDEIRATQWWTLAELDSTAERVRPEGLAGLIRKLPGRLPAG
jgi:ADP-ribose pyrophosphatase YjhB (NUDIX family)